mmetsp:Transcript_14630/g.24971  ORF Transcript_14630/g.24971 Transcript_14630/m.24971 type:complete len:147 (+) Transcript_14630:133-573(+)|eukprot:CAMPEP_0196659580 /NCGR_PEP_ID=MMETSP1086-20130531/35699_1 /TAXON_ID=77921 /ORGANISM="Cyanoptyche  gloeocystis , Strain SAG4.97" /LENGTH=146 /DNA_ID=CAMNT_0041993617 /DNA_START=114 /DNA_END=554 /DNA_ORIENTATION=-
MLDLVPFGQMTVDIEPAHQVGSLMAVPVTGGHIEGDRLKGKVVGVGNDFIRVQDGVGSLNVAFCIETEDSAKIFVSYIGKLHLKDVVTAALAAKKSTEFSDTYWVVSLKFETADDKYKWLEGIVVLGQGRLRDGAVNYALYELVAS